MDGTLAAAAVGSLGVGNAAAAVLGGLVGSFGTYLAQKRLHAREAETRLRNLRLALRAEVRSNQGTIETLLDTVESRAEITATEDVPALASIPTVVYESNADKVGDLTGGEAELVVDYYTQLIGVQEALRTGVDLDADFESRGTDETVVVLDHLLHVSEDLVAELDANLPDG